MQLFKLKSLIIGIILLFITAFTYAESRVEFKNNRLKVDGKPFFFYGCWGIPGKDYMEFKRRYFNTAFLEWRCVNTEGLNASAAGLMVIPYSYAPHWNEEMKKVIESIADKKWILAWNIGDDLGKRGDIESTLELLNFIKKKDFQDRPIMLDAAQRYNKFAKIPDMWGAYGYPLLKQVRRFPNLEGYGEWLNQMRLLGRPDGFFWTWVQCHAQIWYSKKYLGGTNEDRFRPSYFPDGDHLRLLSAHAISAGSRGLMWFMYKYFQDDHFGRDRYDRAAVIGAELKILGPLIAQGKIMDRLQTSDPSVWATPIDFPGGRLVCLIKTGKNYQFQPDAAEVKNVRIEGLDAKSKVFQIGFELKQLAEPKVSFCMTSWLLLTTDRSLIQMIQDKHKAVLQDMAGFVVNELSARIDKVKSIFIQLETETSAIIKAQDHLEKAQKLLKLKSWSDAARTAEEGLGILRKAQYKAWSEIWTADLWMVSMIGFPITDFYLLPFVKKDKMLNFLKDIIWN